MGISNSLLRITDYYQRHGLVATVRRAVLAARRTLFRGRTVLFYCDLVNLRSRSPELPGLMKVEHIVSHAEVSPEDLQQMTSFWNPKQAHQNIQQRFERGATLWLIKCQNNVAGYGWTLRGDTVEPHYFPLGQEDTHFFDFHVFPEYRGRGINALLVNYILCCLALHCQGRAFIETAEWNQAQLRSLQKTPFCRLGLARSFTLLHQTLVFWAQRGA